jgi:hypothetical protein
MTDPALTSSPGGRSPAWLRRALVWGTGWVAAGAFYLLLIDTTDLPELLVGAGAAMIAATAFLLGREQYAVAETIRLGWLRRLARPLFKVPGDVVTVSAAALRQLVRPRAACGRFRVARFRCGEDEALQISRHALAESAGSFAPNTIIVGVDRDRELILAHQLKPKGGDEAIDVMELG